MKIVVLIFFRLWSCLRDRHLIHLRFSASESIGFSLPPGPECPWHKNGHKELIDLFDPSHGAQFLDHFLRYLPSIFAIFHSISHHFPLRFSHFRFPKDPVRFLSSPLSQLRNAAFFLVKVSARYPAGAGLYPRTKLEVLPQLDGCRNVQLPT